MILLDADISAKVKPSQDKKITAFTYKGQTLMSPPTHDVDQSIRFVDQKQRDQINKRELNKTPWNWGVRNIRNDKITY